MFNQLLGQNNYRSYNIKIANTFGLEAAVYLEELISEYNSLKESDVYFHINREYIKAITTLSVDTQRSIDKIFNSVNIVSIEDNDTIKINYSTLINLFNDKNEEISAQISLQPVKKRTKTDVIKDELKLLIKTDNGELRDAYASWIDSVFAKQGWMSKKSVELGQKLIDEYSKRNLDIAIELLDIASVGGYRDIQWAINSYEENLKKRVSKIPITVQKVFETKKKVELAQEVF